VDESQLRDAIRALVLARHPIDRKERASIAEFVRQLDLLAHPFAEEADITHVTGSSIVIGQQGVLLHLHKRAKIWIQPGGHIDDGELPWDGAVRETLEETGIQAEHPEGVPTLIHVDVHAAPKGHTHLDLRYLLIGPDVSPTPPEGESQEVRWFGWDEALALDNDSLTGALLSALPHAQDRFSAQASTRPWPTPEVHQ
jgi:8-oxo-dGTP pyrophosphatase MutT (NUDIX family)